MSVQTISPASAPTPPTIRSGSEPRYTFRKAVFLLLGALILSSALAEEALHKVLGLGNNTLMQPDAAAGYVLKPDQHLYRFFAHTDVNHLSMRSPAFAMVKPQGTYRVLLIGDSMTYGGTQIDQNRIFASLLAAELPAQLHRPVEVLNASASAYGIGNELGFLRSRGTFHADEVVLVLNSGDMGQATSKLSNVGGEASTVSSGCAFCELWTRYIGPRVFHIRRKVDAGSQKATNAPETVTSNIANLDEFRRIIAEHNTRMGIIFLAARSWMTSPVDMAATPSLVSWAQTHNVPLVDTSSAEFPYSARKITLDGTHFNTAGHRVAATAIERNWATLDPAANQAK